MPGLPVSRAANAGSTPVKDILAAQAPCEQRAKCGKGSHLHMDEGPDQVYGRGRVLQHALCDRQARNQISGPRLGSHSSQHCAALRHVLVKRGVIIHRA